MGAHRSGSAWTKRGAGPRAEKAVLEELRSRKLDTIETCRKVWEQALDPAAVVEAVRLSNLPEWLADALIVVLFDSCFGKGTFADLWKRANAARRDRTRAIVLASARSSEPLPKWEHAEEAARRATAKHASKHAIRKSYRQTRLGLSAGRLDFYLFNDGIGDRLDEAVGRVAKLMDDAVERMGKTVYPPKPPK